MKRCELCSEAAAVFCSSDSAYLCNHCDSAVHAANFLVARHLRSSLCSNCAEFSCGSFSGHGNPRRARDLCRSCGGCEEESSICVSTTESSSGEVSSSMRRRKERNRSELEGVLVNWCRRLGLNGSVADVVVSTASGAYQRLPCVRIRVALATSFWVGVRYLGEKEVATCRNLSRVEKITGVPAKEILALERKMRRVVKARGNVAPENSCEEGWAEC